MSERGIFAVDRGLFDHPRFAAEPYTEREAWTWMISEAAYRAHTRRIGSVTVELERGQFAHSTRFMAERWKWSEARVRRFLQRLKGDGAFSDAMIETETDAGVTVVTLLKYSKYQRVSLPSDAQSDAPRVAAATQQRRKEESQEVNKKVPTEPKSPSADLFGKPTPMPSGKPDDWPLGYFEEFWKIYPRRVAKQDAQRAAEKIRKTKTVPFGVVLAGAARYAEHVKGDEERYIKHPATWLNGGCWDDELKPNGARINGNGHHATARRSKGDDFFAGLASVAEDLDRDGAMAGASGPDIPRGRFEFDA